jgi:hypothetical protein
MDFHSFIAILTELLARYPFKYSFWIKRFFGNHFVLAVPRLFLWDSGQGAKGEGGQEHP